MAARQFNKVAIIGVGLLGGSLGLALKQRRLARLVVGVGRRQESLDKALACKAIDRAYLDAAEGAAGADLVVLASPVGAFERHLKAIAPVLGKRTIVTDVGSTKAAVVRAGSRIAGSGRFIGGHPMAGSERKGVEHASADLFEGAKCIITPTPQTPPALAKRAETFWQAIGMKTLRMTPAAHDKAVARVSHLPHALAALLMLLPDDGELDVAATGFRDMTRLAGGDAEVWRDIFTSNRAAVLDAIDRFDESLMHLRDLVELCDAEGIEKFLVEAHQRRSQHLRGQTK